MELTANFKSNDLHYESGAPAILKTKTGNIDIHLGVRGMYRLTQCDFPPLKVMFTKGSKKFEFSGSGSDLKLVTNCGSLYGNQSDQREKVLLEELIYKLYGSYTDLAFKTKIIEMSYKQSNDKEPFNTSFSFFIEKDSKLASRCDLKKAKRKYGSRPVGTWGRNARDFVFTERTENFNKESLAKLTIFQELIENFDTGININLNPYYSKANSTQRGGSEKNVKRLVNEGLSQVFLIPYDFDMSNLVNGSRRSSNFRKWIQNHSNIDLIRPYLLELSNKKEKFMEVLNKSNLNKRSKGNVLKFLKKKFRELEKSL